MNQAKLKAKLSEFERILTVRLRAAGSLGEALREVFAAESAHELFSDLLALCPQELEVARALATADQPISRPLFPDTELIKRKAPLLMESVAQSDSVGIAAILQELGILALCPPTSRLLDGLEMSVSIVVGISQVLPMIELARVATKLDAFERAAEYSARSHSLDPGAPELHDLHTIEGIIALSEGNRERAKECLVKSVHVCERNEYACLSCGIRACNTSLAHRLLEYGEKGAVIDYFLRCRAVWRFLKQRIDTWIAAIEREQAPDFSVPSVGRALDSPLIKLKALVTRGSFLSDLVPVELGTERAIADTQAALEEMRDSYRNKTAAALKGKLELHKN